MDVLKPLCLLTYVLLATFYIGTTFAAEPPISIDLNKQLLIDDQVIANTKNLTRRLGTVTKANNGAPLHFFRTVNGSEKAPVDAWPLFASVYYDPARQRFRMWHRVSLNDTSRRKTKANATVEELGIGTSYHRAYSESKDGLHFELVSLLQGLTTSGDTNLVVTIDDHESDPAHRYKIGYDCDGPVHAAALAHSADGINWTPYNQGKPVTYRASDFPNQIEWDPALKTYRLLTRTDFGDGGGPLAGKVNVKIGDKFLEVRGVRSMTNPDVKAHPDAWTLEHHFLFDGEESIASDCPPISERLQDPQYLDRVRREALRRQIYAMTDWLYEGVHFGLMAVLEYPTDVSEGLNTDHITRHERSIENFYIATSRDGVHWNFHWVYAGQPIVPRGTFRAWDKDMIFPTTRIITHQDKHWIYYGANNERHGSAEKNVWFGRDGSIGLAWLRLDGFVALEATEQTGQLTTKTFHLTGKHLQLNVDAHDQGSIRVEILNAAGNPIPGYTLDQSIPLRNIDGLRLQPTWKDHPDLSPLVGQAIQLRIHLQHARLYAFQIQL